MRRESAEVVAAVAQQRLAELGRELGRELPTVSPGLALVEPGRHSRRRSASPRDLLVDQLARARVRLAGSIGMRRAHLSVVLVVAAIAVTVAWWGMRGTSSAVPLSPRTGSPSSSISSAAATSTPSGLPTSNAASLASVPPTSTPSGSVPASVVVDVTGKVRRPGVATLPAGSRVIDALRHAGGARKGVDLSGLNLARVLVDGEQILVGPGRPAAASTGSAEPSSDASGTSSGPAVNINSAGPDALEQLPGVGPVTAQKIIAWRTAHGAFASIDELLEVDGIGPKTLAELAPHATL